MGAWTIEELETAFAGYQAAVRSSVESGDWTAWADLFTEDVDYIEHMYGPMKGRGAVLKWMTETMSTYPNNAMEFPFGWHVVDEERGWIVCQVWTRMGDPGDGSIHETYNFTLLKYAGEGLWSYEEDIYNPANFASMISTWQEQKDRLARNP
jgi:SnoaL-like domain